MTDHAADAARAAAAILAPDHGPRLPAEVEAVRFQRAGPTELLQYRTAGPRALSGLWTYA